MTSVIPRLSTKFFLILVLLGIVIVPASAVILPPVQDPNIPISGDVNFFFWNGSSNVNGIANRFATYPQLQDTTLKSALVSSTIGEVTLAEFATDPFPTGATMAPGLTRYRFYANVSSSVGTTTINFIPFIRYANGTDQRLFYGISRTADIGNTAPLTYADETLISYARRNYTAYPPGSSMFIQVNATSSSTVARTISLAVAGTNTASMAVMGYWEAAEGVPSDLPTAADSGSIGLAVAGGIVGGIVSVLYWKRRFKK